MNPIAIIHGVVALVAIGLSLPLLKRKVGPNPWYGVRIPESFKSTARWYEINEYGGRLMLGWGLAIVATSGIGLMLPVFMM
jgi:hypothetical protein